METPPGFVKIAGNPWPSLPAILAIAFYAILLIIILFSENIGEISLLMLPSVALIFYATGTGMYYFLISDKQIIVKNHAFFWFSRTYNFDEIKRLGFTKTGKWNNIKAFFISANKRRYRVYATQCFRKADWEQLRKIITSKSIPFTDKPW